MMKDEPLWAGDEGQTGWVRDPSGGPPRRATQYEYDEGLWGICVEEVRRHAVAKYVMVITQFYRVQPVRGLSTGRRPNVDDAGNALLYHVEAYPHFSRGYVPAESSGCQGTGRWFLTESEALAYHAELIEDFRNRWKMFRRAAELEAERRAKIR